MRDRCLGGDRARDLRHEPTYYTAEDRLVTFEHRVCRCGIMMFYDGDFPETTRVLGTNTGKKAELRIEQMDLVKTAWAA